MNFTTFVKLIGALLFCPLLSACRTEFNHCDMEEQHCNDTIVRFAVIGDWGMWGSSDQRKVAESMAIVATECPFDFIVSVGDNFYSNGVTSTEDPLWQSCFEEVYTSPALQCPWYVVLGNHDYRGQPQAELDYTSLSDRWVMPAKHFKVSENRSNGLGVDLFFMDSNPFQDDIAGTAAHPTLNAADTVIEHSWITNELANSINQWKFVFAHHPMYTCGMRKQLPQYMRELESEFASAGVQAYVCGHEHDLQIHHPPSGLTCLVSGAGAQARPIQSPFNFTTFARSELGYMIFEVMQSKTTVKVYNEHAQILHTEQILP